MYLDRSCKYLQTYSFGLFYRSPNSDDYYYSNIEDSLALALNTGIADIIVTGDFNLNVLNSPSARKIEGLVISTVLTLTIY